MGKQRRFKRKSCKHKQAYPNKNVAYMALRALTKKRFIFHKMNAYQCGFCNKWHIGRTKKVLYETFERLR